MILCPVQGPCRVTQRYGANPAHYQQYGIAGHDGLDVTGPTPGVSVPTYSPYDGLISIMTGKPGWTAYGNCVVIHTLPDNQGLRREVVLGHHKSITVKDGQWVHLGDPVGMMGESGSATGLHLHLGLRYLLPDGSVKDYANGFHGWQNFGPAEDPERYILFWGDRATLVRYPHG